MWLHYAYIIAWIVQKKAGKTHFTSTLVFLFAFAAALLCDWQGLKGFTETLEGVEGLLF